jgi:probable rRNA maturation factor
MEIMIDDRQSRHQLPKQKIQKTAERILSALGYPEGELSILIVDDEQIAKLNTTYLNHDGPTNVISFPMQEGPFTEVTPNLLGDVVISADTAHQEAVDAGMETMDRFYQLLIHGILHLVGYDHVHSAEEAQMMDQKSDELFKWIGKED